jgi:hypothetical protein
LAGLRDGVFVAGHLAAFVELAGGQTNRLAGLPLTVDANSVPVGRPSATTDRVHRRHASASRERRQQYQALYYAAHRQRIIAWNVAYWKSHRLQTNAAKRSYYARHRERVLAQWRARYHAAKVRRRDSVSS